VGRAVRFTPDVPGAPEIEVVPDVLRGSRVYVAGRRIALRHDRGAAFAIPMADGTERPLRLAGGFLGLRATFDGVVYPVEPRLSLWETFLVVLPLAILGLGLEAPTLAGSAVAAVVAGAGVGLALIVVRTSWPAWLRSVAAIGVTAVGYVAAGVVASVV
jgi:hypothetical protein